jgi:excisionase family DNA binding protein
MRMAEDVVAGNAVSTPLAVRVPEACRLTGIGRSKLYELIAAGEIRIIRLVRSRS